MVADGKPNTSHREIIIVVARGERGGNIAQEDDEKVELGWNGKRGRKALDVLYGSK